jgi:DNA adenine methylase
MSKKINSPLRSFGGKGSNVFLKEIYPLFPDYYECLIEPFCGSAIVTLNNPIEKCTEVINDLNQNIYSFYKVVQDKDLFQQLKEKLDLTCYHEDLFYESKKSLKNDLNLIDRSYHFFVLNRMSFNGNNGSFGKNYAIRRNMSKSTSDFLSAVDGLDIIHRRISQMIITNRDGLKLIEENGKYENTFFFLDPPYDFTTRTSFRYPVDFTPEQQNKMVELLTNDKMKSKFLLCGYDNELYENVLVKQAGWYKHTYEIKTITGTNKSKTKVECLWKNY